MKRPAVEDEIVSTGNAQVLGEVNIALEGGRIKVEQGVVGADKLYYASYYLTSSGGELIDGTEYIVLV